MAEEKSGGAGKKITIAFLIIVAVVAAGWLFLESNKSAGVVVDSSKYQAVFLTNGQVYFGRVANEKKSYVSVSDVYYLVLKQPLQNQKTEGETQPQDQAKPEYSLIKLGKEMHGPTSMSINRDQILFIENLADDSKVVSTIKNQK